MNELAVVKNQMSITDAKETAKIYAMSGLFGDNSTKGIAELVVKIQFGSSIGLDAMSSANGIHVIKGKPAMGAGLLGALLKRSGKYNFRVLEHTDEICVIEFYENGEPCGRSSFSIEEAKTAGLLSKDMWSKYRKAMLYSRAMTQGVRWYAPDVTLGSIYSPEELRDGIVSEDDTYDGEIGGEVIDIEVKEVVEKPEQRQEKSGFKFMETTVPSPKTGEPVLFNEQVYWKNVSRANISEDEALQFLSSLDVMDWYQAWEATKSELFIS